MYVGVVKGLCEMMCVGVMSNVCGCGDKVSKGEWSMCVCLCVLCFVCVSVSVCRVVVCGIMCVLCEMMCVRLMPEDDKTR